MKENPENFNSYIENVISQLSVEGEASFRELARSAGLDPAKDFIGADLSGLDMRDEDLSGFDFTDADLRYVDFRRANLTDSKFSGADLFGAIGLGAEHDSPQFVGGLRELKRILASGVLPGGEPVRLITELRFGDTAISDISILAALPQIARLSLINRRIQDFSPLSRLPALRHLELDGSNISSFEQTGGLPNATHVSAMGTPLSNLAGLGSEDSLRTLDVSRTYVDDLRPLASYNLSSLYAAHTGISNINPLSEMHQLATLNISYTLVDDVSPLQRLSKLRNLHISSTAVSSISQIPLDNIRYIDCSDTRIKDLYDIKYANNLESIFIDGNKDLLNIDAILGDNNIKLLSVSDCALNGSFDVSGMRKLDILNLSNNSVTNLIIPTSADIKNINLDGNPINSLRFLSHAKRVRSLSIIGTDVKDLEPILELNGIFNLHVDSMPSYILLSLFEDKSVMHVTLLAESLKEIQSDLPKNLELVTGASSYSHERLYTSVLGIRRH